MRRSLELLIAEEIFKAGEKQSFEYALSHINRGNFSVGLIEIRGQQYWYITVVYDAGVFSVWEIDFVSERVRKVFSNYPIKQK